MNNLTMKLNGVHYIRPRVDEDLIYQLREKYREETQGKSNEKVLDWALKRFLSFQEQVLTTGGE